MKFTNLTPHEAASSIIGKYAHSQMEPGETLRGLIAEACQHFAEQPSTQQRLVAFQERGNLFLAGLVIVMISFALGFGFRAQLDRAHRNAICEPVKSTSLVWGE